MTGKEHADRFLMACIAARNERIGRLLEENRKLRRDLELVDRNRRKWAGATVYGQ